MIDCPVFGFHAGDVLTAFEKVSRLGWPPLPSVTYSSGLPCMDDEKISCEPSGDHAGELFVPLKRGNEITFPESIEYMQICGPVTLPNFAKHVNAIREASGDQRGVRAMECREVKGRWLAPS